MSATVKTVTAATAGSDTLTAVAHGLTSGDRFRLRNVGGALPAATPSLAQGTDYYARRVDADTLNIYDTNAHAVAGGSTGLVDITGALGTGTTTVEYGLPYAVPTIVPVAGVSQIRSADSIDTWAAIAALHQLLTAGPQSIWTVSPNAGLRGAEITPSSMSGTTNDYAPTNGSTAGVIRQGVATGTPGATLTGMSLSQVAGRRVSIVNIAVDGDLLVKHESASSSAANRFTLPGNADLTIPFNTNKQANFVYDGTSQRWRLESKNF